MKPPFAYNTPVIFLAVGLIVLSTFALSVVSYHYSVGRENPAETTLVQSNIKLALHYVDRIEQQLIDNDRIMAGMVDVNDPEQWAAMAEGVKNAGLNVEEVYFLRPGSSYPLFPPYSHEIRNQWSTFRAGFDIREIDFGGLVHGEPYHIHRERGDDYFFATYFLKETGDGSNILVCYQMNFDGVIAMLDGILRDLEDRFYVGIVDYENNIVYGQPVSRASTYFFETRFPTTLYKWILQIVPRNYSELESGVKKQQRTSLFFIVVSMTLIFISLSIIYIGWRHDRQLRQLKEDFISNVSHELKTPLSLIRMFSEILFTGRVADEERKREYYRIIHSESDRMSRLINNLLDFADLMSGVDQRHFEKTNIARIVAEALEAYRHEVEKDGFRLNLEIPETIPDSFADPNAVTMAFLNLLDNSVKYSGGAKQIDVLIERENGFVNLKVIDRGIGIPASEQGRIFEKFYRGREPSVRNIRGSGIGLAITRHVAEMHCGEVSVTSDPGKGSTFILRIPIRTNPDDSDTGNPGDDAGNSHAG